jgi:hypothetical protein
MDIHESQVYRKLQRMYETRHPHNIRVEDDIDHYLHPINNCRIASVQQDRMVIPNLITIMDKFYIQIKT